MTMFRDQLELKLAGLPGVDLELYKDSDLLCVLFKGKEFAHFHNGLPELDVRIPKKFAKRHELGEPYQSARHPDRSKNSIWRVLTYSSEQEVDELVELVGTLLNEAYSDEHG